jgi:hypothetical protein
LIGETRKAYYYQLKGFATSLRRRDVGAAERGSRGDRMALEVFAVIVENQSVAVAPVLGRWAHHTPPGLARPAATTSFASDQRVPPSAGPMTNSATKLSMLTQAEKWIASLSLSPGAHSPDRLAPNDVR